MLRLEHLVIGYGTRAVASVEDCTLTPDRLWMVHGPNGAGKTTLLKTLAGLLPAVSGAVSPAVPTGPNGAVYVHSVPVLWRGTARSNLQLVAADSDVANVAERFDLMDWLDVRTSELSHGIRQRVSLARAIVCAPRLLLIDEPEGGLDQRAAARWTTFLESAIREARMTVVIAAHRPSTLDVPASAIGLTPTRP